MMNMGFTGGGAPTLASIYQSQLGRAPDAAGMQYYQGQLNEGRSIYDIQKEIARSSEASQYSASRGGNSLEGIYQAELGRAPDQAGLDYYQGQLSSGRSLDDIRREINSSAEGLSYQPSNVFSQSGDGFALAMQALAESLSQPLEVPQITPQTLPSTNLQSYQNPYTDEVVDKTLADLERQRQIAINATGAGAGGAYGGSRHGIMEAETNRAYGDISARTGATMRSDSFGQAQQAAMQDIQNDLMAQQANQAAMFQQLNDRRATAGLLAQVAGQGFGLGNSALAAQGQAGAQQQGLTQDIIDAGKGQTLGFTGDADTQLQRLLAAVGGVPFPKSETSSQSSSPGLFGLLTAFL